MLLNKLKEYILKNGKYIGSGSTRVALKLGKRIYKFPYRPTGYEQSENERKLYAQIKDKRFFPNPKFFSNGIVSADYIPPLEELINYYSDNPVEDIIQNNLSSVEQIKDFLKLMIDLSNMEICVDEFTHNGGNIGVKDGDIYILDWGILDLEKVRSSSADYYKYMENLLIRFGHDVSSV